MSLPTAEQLMSLPTEFLAEDTSRRALNTGIAFLVLNTFFLGLFTVSRLLHNNKDPWYVWGLVYTSYVCVVALCIGCILYATIGGGGRHIAFHLLNDPAPIKRLLQIQTSLELVYVLSITAPRLTLLLLYLKIFTDPLTRKITWVVAAIVVLNFFPAAFVEYWTICTPFQYKWDKTIDGHCADLYAAYTWISIPNIMMDIAILLLPIKTIWNLQVSRSQKLGIFLTFLAGGLGIVTAIVRFVGFFTADQQADLTFNTMQTFVLTAIEPSAYFICACMPYIRPLAFKVYQASGMSQLRSFSTRNTKRSSAMGSRETSRSKEMPLHNIGNGYSASVAVNKGSNISEDRVGFIHLEESVEVTRSRA